jgi:hypothetical protein
MEQQLPNDPHKENRHSKPNKQLQHLGVEASAQRGQYLYTPTLDVEQARYETVHNQRRKARFSHRLEMYDGSQSHDDNIQA